ncbi:MAG TPA: HAD-IA family hydrolase [Nitrospinota bacterium]|jgi:phosphoglycolate phosphatase|nr:HAD-IA family hydrolase [Nitrospinota bacterium]|tara:strand:- start:320402 stop:321061 length:660 start_codon:yes stop_codon:yes gene_type:complete
MEKLEPEVIVFDLDGTLIDSKQDIANALNWTFDQLGYPPLPMKTIEQFVGNGVAPLIRLALEDAGHLDREVDVVKLFRSRYWDHLLDHTIMFETVFETLEELRNSYKLGVISNKPEQYTKRIVKKLGLYPHFGAQVYGGDTLSVKKPKPDALLKIAQFYGMPIEKVLMVGDSGVDAKTAFNAGAMFVGVTYGFRDMNEIRSAGATMFIDKFEQLMDLLN